MATKSMSYDHPAYLVPHVPAGRLSGNAGTFKFSAYTAMLVKSYTLGVQTAGTSASDVVTAYKISGTATTTHALSTFSATQTGNTNALGTFTLAQGDVVALVKGTDATIDYGVAVECILVPGTTITS